MKKIIVDIFGADLGAEPIVEGAFRTLRENSDLFLVFTGDSEIISREAEKQNISTERFEIIHTTKYVTNNDPPTCVFRGCDDTSMVMALMRLKEDDTCVGMISAGNTGALLVGTICRLGLLPSLKAPVLATAIPCRKEGLVCLLDCGANTECSAEDLKRYAVMGNAFMQSLTGNPSPKVGLMSVGKEKGKGNALTKAAFEKISLLPINFVGNVEGSDLTDGDVDVIVADGFTGNVLLKNTESAGKAALSAIELLPESDEKNAAREEILRRFDFNSRGGATFLGARKTVVKMHGCAVADTAFYCIDQVLRLEENKFSENIAKALE